jgi:hypothetical protein
MATKNVMVLVDDKHGSSLDSVTEALKRDGVRIEQVMRSLKTIVGAVSDDATIERVRHLDGVASIREEGKISLPPMDRSIPQ